MFNLDEQLASKTTKQIEAMIDKRILKDIESNNFLLKYDCYPYNDQKKYITQIKKHNQIVTDCSDWLSAAFLCVSSELWDQIVSKTYTDQNGNNHCVIDMWNSSNMI